MASSEDIVFQNEVTAAERYARLNQLLFEVAFGESESSEGYGGSGRIFYKLPIEDVVTMPEVLQQSYRSELAYARDPCTGMSVAPLHSAASSDKP